MVVLDTDHGETRVKLIGGLFGLTTAKVQHDGCAPSFLSDQNIFLANATSALAVLIGRLQPAQVWLPSYTCVALLIAARQAGITARLFPVDSSLCLKSGPWLQDVRPGDVVVMIDYFGWPIPTDDIETIRARGAWLVEDATQAMLSDRAGSWGDFAVVSPRKFLGVPDGGILMLNHSLDLSGVELAAPPADWWLTAFNAALLRRQFDAHGGSRDWFQLFQHAEANAPVGAFRMSELSHRLLTNCFDFSSIRVRRRANYDRLASSLRDLALFGELPPSVVPLAFPIRVSDRDRIRQTLFGHGIYPPVHWSLDGVVPDSFSESHQLASEIMSLPCDQRYDERDMDRMARLVRAALA